MTSIFSSNDGVQQIFGDEGENAQDFDKWMEGIMNGGTDVCSAAQHIAAPVLGNLANVFGNSPDGDGASILWLQGPGSGVRSRDVGRSVALAVGDAALTCRKQHPLRPRPKRPFSMR